MFVELYVFLFCLDAENLPSASHKLSSAPETSTVPVPEADESSSGDDSDEKSGARSSSRGGSGRRSPRAPPARVGRAPSVRLCLLSYGCLTTYVLKKVNFARHQFRGKKLCNRGHFSPSCF